VLDAIGKLIGRPGLADYAKAKAEGDPTALEQFARQHPEAMPAPAGAKPKVTTAALLHRARAASREVRSVVAATVVAAIGAVGFMLRMGIESLESESSYLYLAAPVASSAVFAAGLWRGGALAFGRALFSILAGVVGYAAALFTFPLIQPVAALIGIPGPATLGFSQGLLAGGVGALVALTGIALLLGNIRRQGWLAVLIGSVVLGVVCGSMGAGLLSALYPSNFFWMVLAWTLGYGALISVLVSRSARIM
jgi:hypothetical protein